MRTLKLFTIILLFPLMVTAASTDAGPASGWHPSSAQTDTPGPGADAQRRERDRQEDRRFVRVRDHNGESFVWTFGDGGPRGYLGVGVIRLTPELRRHFGAPEERGVMVSKVVDDSPAAAAGLAVGDIFLSVDDEPIDGEWDLVREIARHEEGETVAIEVLRDGAGFTVDPTLEERDRQVVDLMPMFRFEWPGEDLRKLHELRIDMPELGVEAMERGIAIREKDIERAMRSLRKRLDSPEFRQRIAEATRRSAELERRTAELERRLAELQRQIAGLQAQEDP